MQDEIRKNYEREVYEISQDIDFLQEQKYSAIQIAIYANARRLTIGRKYKLQRPEEYRDKIFKRNKEKYGNKWGPTWKYMLTKYFDASKIIQASIKVNSNYDEFEKDIGVD
jgi:hypothetical protein